MQATRGASWSSSTTTATRPITSIGGGQDQPAGGHPGVPAQAGDRDRDGGDRAQVNIGDQVSQKSNYLSKLIINIKN